MRGLDLTGRRFGRLVAIDRVPGNPSRTRWNCICDCGNRTVTLTGCLIQGQTTSCGCFKKEVVGAMNRTHGHARGNRTYKIWGGMIQRCYNSRNQRFADYGGRGIDVIPAWHSFEAFLADMGEAPDGLTIDRKDNSKGYSPDNCRWATVSQQNRNKDCNTVLEFRGEKLCLSDWCDRTGIDVSTMSARLSRLGWSVEKALTTPTRIMRFKTANRTSHCVTPC